MSLVVLDIECIENKIVKELGVYKNGQTVGYSFLPPKNSKLHLSLLGVQSIFMESIGTVALKITRSLKKYLKNEKLQKRSFLQKVMNNVKFCQKFWKQRLQTWMTTHIQKFRI